MHLFYCFKLIIIFSLIVLWTTIDEPALDQCKTIISPLVWKILNT